MGFRFIESARRRAGHSVLLVGALLAGICAGTFAQAPEAVPRLDARVMFELVDVDERPLEQAVVWAIPLSGQALPTVAQTATLIEQRGKTFIPLVTPVRVGTAVDFPNLDTVRHHVYSFSPAKVFSLKLYIGTPAEPVTFDKPGEVVLGCNIHDGMLAYVMALETPFFGKTDVNGQAELVGLVPGEYELRAWHPRQMTARAAERIIVQEGERLARRLVVDVPSQRRAAAGS